MVLKGIATDVRISAAFPSSLKAGEKGQVDAIISAQRTIIPRVWDEAFITAEEDVIIAYIPSSANIYNDGKVKGSELSSDDLFSVKGAQIGYYDLDGLIPACDQYSGMVFFRLSVSPSD